MKRLIFGKFKGEKGIPPAIGLINPKYPHNIGEIIRATSCFGIRQIWFTGDRVALNPDAEKRIPREERMRGYKDIELYQFDHFLEQFDSNATPVAIEVKPGCESLPQFKHPENPVYIFGPEDGTLPSSILRLCHRFVAIPTRHCTNLAGAVYIVLYDRLMKRQQLGLEPILPISETFNEDRDWVVDRVSNIVF